MLYSSFPSVSNTFVYIENRAPWVKLIPAGLAFPPCDVRDYDLKPAYFTHPIVYNPILYLAVLASRALLSGRGSFTHLIKAMRPNPKARKNPLNQTHLQSWYVI